MKIQVTENQFKTIMEMSFKAYHGTPHSFDKFDINKVGTGESTQWFGWGIYLTDDEGIADWYAKSVPELQNQDRENEYILYFKGNEIGKKMTEKYTMSEVPSINSIKFVSLLGNFNDETISNIYEFVRRYLISGLKSYFSSNQNKSISWINIINNCITNKDKFFESAIQNLKNFYGENTDLFNQESKLLKKDLDTIVDIIRNLKETDFEYKPKDKIKKSYKYDVTVNKDKTPDQYDYLSWYDELTSNQKQKIVSQIKIEKLKKNIFYIVKPEDDESNIQPKFFKTLSDANQYKKMWNQKNIIPMFGVGVDQVVVQKGTFTVDDLNGTVKDFYTQLCGLLGSPKEASMFLLRSGIDGIKFPSNSIAGGESKGFNYVIFDDKSINIDKRNEKNL